MSAVAAATLLSFAGAVVSVAGIYPAVTRQWRLQRRLLVLAGLLYGAAGVADLVASMWQLALIDGAVVALIVWAIWLDRRRRDRARRMLGEKSRARVRALVVSMREAAAPRHALRPVPGGAS